MRVEKYRPLDATLDLLSVRMLRAMRHFDAVEAADLTIAMDEPDGRDISWALRFHAARGRVQRVDRGARKDPAWRITDAGIRWLDRMIRRGQLAAFEVHA